MPGTLKIILGPTAVGKTDYAIKEALSLGSPVISCDSRQVFREMTIGTAVPDSSQLAAVKHYFIHTRSVTEPYTAGMYELDAIALIESLFAQGHETLVMAGGSMFYIDAVCRGLDDLPPGDPLIRSALAGRLAEEGVESLARQLRELDPITYDEIDISNGRRVIRALEVCLSTGKPLSSYKTRTPKQRSFGIVKIGLRRQRDDLRERIRRRTEHMFEEGLEDEARSLLPFRGLTSLDTVGYREMFDYIDGKCSLQEAQEAICSHTWNYARRQMTWWKRDPEIIWKDLT